MNSQDNQHYLKEEFFDLSRNDRRFFAFLDEEILDGIWCWDIERPENEWISRRFWEVLGHDPAEMPHSPKSWQDLVDPEDLRTEAVNSEMHCENPEHPYDQVLRFRHKDGLNVKIRRRGFAIRDASGRAIRMMGIHTSLTGRSERRVAAADEKKAEVASRLKTVFLTDLSHDLRTPLNSLLAMAEALASTELEPDQREMLDDMKQAGDQLTHLLSDMLDVSKIESGEISMEREEFSPAELLRDIETSVMEAAKAKRLNLAVDFSFDEEIRVIGAGKRIRQATINLVSNAIKFTQLGSITVAAAITKPEAGDGVELTVRITDTGPGIPDKLKPQALRRFRSDPGYLFANSQGLGIGLSIADTICRLHGGNLTVQDAPSGGAEFVAVFRVLPTETSKNLTRKEEVKRPFSGLRMLIAEDVLLNRRSLKKLLADTDVELTFAIDGEEALRLLKTTEFDVALIDLRMPRLSGLDVLRKYREFEAQHSHRRLHAIACSAYLTAEEWPECEEVGFQGILEKPFTKTELTEIVTRVIEGN